MTQQMYLPTFFVRQRFAMTTNVPDQRVDFRVAAGVAVALDALMSR